MSPFVGVRRWGVDRWRWTTTDPTSLALVVLVAIVAALLAYLMDRGSYDAFAAIPVGLGLLLLSVPLIRRAVALESDDRIIRLLWIALPLKLLAALGRYAMAFELYDGQADASSYHREGARIAVAIRGWDYPIEIGRGLQGTGFIRVLTGAIYAVTGATSIGGFLVFSWLSFWGLYFLYRAFVRACPEGNQVRYAFLTFLLPSLVFWPSSIGKEAWMTLGLGLGALGAARVFTHARGGLILLLLGGAATAVVRPHVTAIFATSIVLGYVVRRPPSTATILAPIGKLFGLIALVGLAAVAIGQLQSYLGVDAFDRQSVELTLDEVALQTGQGGSAFEVTSSRVSPADIPYALVTIVLRPFPWEASNIQSALSSMEGVVLIGLMVAGRRRLLGGLRAFLRTPYVVLCATYMLLFSYGFSSFNNFGILARQRVQILPFVLVLLCLPPYTGRLRDAPGALLLDERAP